jgi:hypothetical protein
MKTTDHLTKDDFSPVTCADFAGAVNATCYKAETGEGTETEAG